MTHNLLNWRKPWQKPGASSKAGSENQPAARPLGLREQDFRQYLDGFPLGIRICNNRWDTVYANQAALDIFGFKSLDEMKSTSIIKEMYVSESRTKHRLRMANLRRGKRVPSSYEIRIRRKDGEIRHLQFFFQKVMWDGVPRFGVLYQDITERKRLERELIRLKQAVETSGEAIFLTDRDGIFQYANPEFTRLYGYQAGEIAGKTPRILKSGVMDQNAYHIFWETLGVALKVLICDYFLVNCRFCPKSRPKPQLVDRLYQHTDIMAQNLTKHLIYLSNG